MNDYEMKQEAKRQRLLKRAELCKRLANMRHERAKQMGSAIPFGQPILIGHHSEGRDRRYRAKIENNYRKSFELAEKAKHYAQRADSVGSGGVSSDDPDATSKLQVELDRRKAKQEHMVAINKLVRKGEKGMAILASEPYNMTPAQIGELFTPDYMGRVGYASYQLTNNNANIRRIEQRIKELGRNQSREEKEYTIAGVQVVENVDSNRLQLFFDGKPEQEIRTRLKSHGFRWAPSEGAWQRQLTGNAVSVVRVAITGKWDGQ